jgi:hypothetical protein
MEIKKVRKDGDKKSVTIPKKSDIQIGDYVKIEKILEQNKQEAQTQ